MSKTELYFVSTRRVWLSVGPMWRDNKEAWSNQLDGWTNTDPYNQPFYSHSKKYDIDKTQNKTITCKNPYVQKLFVENVWYEYDLKLVSNFS